MEALRICQCKTKHEGLKYKIQILDYTDYSFFINYNELKEKIGNLFYFTTRKKLLNIIREIPKLYSDKKSEKKWHDVKNYYFPKLFNSEKEAIKYIKEQWGQMGINAIEKEIYHWEPINK